MKKLIIIAALAMMLFTSCLNSVMVPITYPSKIDLGKIDKIAITSFEGEYGRDISDELTAELFSTDRYEILDRDHIDKILTEIGLSSSGLVNDESAVEIGNLIGAAVLVVGRVTTSEAPEDKGWKELTETKDEEEHTYSVPFRSGKVTMEANIRIIDVSTGKTIAVEQLTEHEAITIEGGRKDKTAPRIDYADLYRAARKNIVRRFVRRMVPKVEFVEKYFKNDKEVPEMKTAIKYAERGDFENANALFGELSSQYPNSYKLWYNYGITQTCVGNFDSAIASLEKAYELEPSDKIFREIKFVKKAKENHEKVENIDDEEEVIEDKQ